MSTRQLRKLQRQKELEIARLRDKEQAEEEEVSDEPSSPPKSKGSLFTKFIDFEGLEGLEDEDDNNVEEHEVETDPIDETLRHISVSKKHRKIRSKKSKKRETRKPEIKSNDGIGGDEIETALRQLGIENLSNKKSQNSSTGLVTDSLENICALISIQDKYLKVTNEMRKLFGKAAVGNDVDSRGTAGQETTHRLQQQDETIDLESVLKGNHTPGKGISEMILRRNFFIQGKSDWPKGTLAGLSMEVVKYDRSDEIVEFRYVHNPSYQKVQNSFHAGVEVGDPQFLVNLLVKNPNHISLLLQVSKIAKSLGNHSLSSDLLERALFFLGKAATSHFTIKLSQGKARLNFARFENRELWLAGYHYIKSLMMKGTYRTALEWAKLLLSLDPKGDPYCMRLLIHNLSLRAHEHEWLFDLYDTGFHNQWSNNPDFISQKLYSHTNASLVLAAIYMRNRDKAREILRQSIVRLPWLYCSLFSDLNLEIPPSLRDHGPRSKSDALFTRIYISQTIDLWDTPETTSLLMEIGYTINKIDEVVTDDDHEDYSKLVTLDVVRFVYLDGAPKILALLSRERMNHEISSESDPIPPIENIISYERQQLTTRDVHQPRSDYLVIGRINANQDSDGDESNSQFTIDGISVAEVTGEGIQRLIPIEAARRLIRHLWGSRSSEDENVDDNHDDESNNNYHDVHGENEGDNNSQNEDELLKERINQAPSELNPEER